MSVSPEYPGTAMRRGSSGSSVARVQTYLNGLAYPQVIKLNVDGKYGANTAKAVTQYQALKGLSADGVVGANTWNTLVAEHSAKTGSSADTYPGISLRSGSKGQDITHMQTLLNQIQPLYSAINRLAVDGSYGQNTQAAARRFQPQFSLNADGIIGRNTWNKIVAVKNAYAAGTPSRVTTAYGGTALKTGSTGDSVRFVQSYLNKTGASLTVDGSYGSATKAAVIKFQAANALDPDGIVGRQTWAKLVTAFNENLTAAV